MEGKTLTETNTSISRKGDDVTVKVVTTTTFTAVGKDPVKTVKEEIKKYNLKDKSSLDTMPDDIRKQLDDIEKKEIDPKKINMKAASSKFEKEMLELTNKLRESHGAQSLNICKPASKYALERATAMAEKDDMIQRGKSDFGENISCMWSNNPEHTVKAEEVVNRWYNENKNYDYDKEPSDLDAGHFTQLVWKDSKEFGVAAVKSKTNKIYVVAAYHPSGNWTGEFKQNVSPQKTGVVEFLKSLIGKKDSDSSSSDDEDDELNKFNKSGLKAHNLYRKKHGVQPLQNCSTLANYAQEWANTLAKGQKFEHRSNNKYGENLYTYQSSSGTKPKAEDAVASWYSEIKDHTFGKEPTSLKTGHFTQVVWKGSSEVGMGIAKSSRGWIVVANYNPPGNFRGQYTENVPAPN